MIDGCMNDGKLRSYNLDGTHRGIVMRLALVPPFTNALA